MKVEADNLIKHSNCVNVLPSRPEIKRLFLRSMTINPKILPSKHTTPYNPNANDHEFDCVRWGE